MPQKHHQSIWRGPSNPRAKQLRPEEWERYRPTIVKLYQTRGQTLDEIMKKMKIEHQFAPTRRQYVRQLEKWGLRKYRCDLSSPQPAEPEPLPPSSPSTPPLDAPDPDNMAWDGAFLTLVEAGRMMNVAESAPSPPLPDMSIANNKSNMTEAHSLNTTSIPSSSSSNLNFILEQGGILGGAADFLLECEMYEDAFRLYFHLYQHARIADYPRLVTSGLFGCYRSVSNASSMAMVETLLENVLGYIEHSHPLFLDYFHKSWGRAHQRLLESPRGKLCLEGVRGGFFKRMAPIAQRKILSDDIQLLRALGTNNKYLALPGKYDKAKGMQKTIKCAYRWCLETLCDLSISTLLERVWIDIFPAAHNAPRHTLRLSLFLVLILRWKNEFKTNPNVREWGFGAFHYLELTIAELLGVTCQMIEEKCYAMGVHRDTAESIPGLWMSLNSIKQKSEEGVEKEFFETFLARKGTVSPLVRHVIEGYILDMAHIYSGIKQEPLLREIEGAALKPSSRTMTAIDAIDILFGFQS